MRCQGITKTKARKCKMHAMLGTKRCYFHTEDDCVICMDRLRRCEACPQCEVKFCVVCLDKWLKKHSTCPTCRVELKAPIFQSQSEHQFLFDTGEENPIFTWPNNEEGWATFAAWYDDVNTTFGIDSIDTVTVTFEGNMQTMLNMEDVLNIEVTSQLVNLT